MYFFSHQSICSENIPKFRVLNFMTLRK
uniref:Uncharacterized protein n=1 Tax=Arundo donax TaxID=35708 RepID=A0A0A8XYY1_ARUDO